jgi:tetratricopeptide (TPR) repeat protein
LVNWMSVMEINMTKNDHLKEGFKYFGLREFVSAEIEFKKALEIDPEFDLALNSLCEVYNKMGRLDEALQIGKQLVQITPNDPLAHAVLSRLYMQKGMIKEAEDELAVSNQLSAEGS